MNRILPVALAALTLGSSALAHHHPDHAGGIHDADCACVVFGEIGALSVIDAYARVAGPAARSAAAYMVIVNEGETADRLIDAETPLAERVELHTHLLEDGVARMVELEDGIDLPPAETVTLAPGGLHVMLMGLREPLAERVDMEITLHFAEAGPLSIVIPVNPDSMPMDAAIEGHGHGHHHGHGHDHGHGHGDPNGGSTHAH